MTHSSPVPVSKELEDHFQAAVRGEISIRYFLVRIVEENIVEISSSPLGSLESDFDSLQDCVTEDEGSYFIFQLNDSKQWLLISYVPDSLPVKNKMLLASAKGTLKDQLGQEYFVEELHVTLASELNFSYYQDSKEPIDARSTSEIAIENARELEEEARIEIAEDTARKQEENRYREQLEKEKVQQQQQQQQQQRQQQSPKENEPKVPESNSLKKNTLGKSLSARNILENKSSSNSVPGYHSVSIPLSSSAENSLNRLKTGSVNYVQLVIDKEQRQVDAIDPKLTTINELPRLIHTAEPRYYLFQYGQSSTGGKLFVFIYCCPERSPPKLRMVYSTSKTSVADQVAALGVVLRAKRIEISDGNELSLELKEELDKTVTANVLQGPQIFPLPGMTGRNQRPPLAGSPELGGVVKARNSPTIGGNVQHPIYALMDKGNLEKPSSKKKIVMPPPGAWQ